MKLVISFQINRKHNAMLNKHIQVDWNPNNSKRVFNFAEMLPHTVIDNERQKIIELGMT